MRRESPSGCSLLPRFYTSLRPFRRGFSSGVPILTWHKLGPRPPGVRLKGLYISRRLFVRQLAELRASGFTSASPEVAATVVPGNPGRQIVLTFDDGCVNVLREGLEPLAQHGFRAIQFLVVDLLGARNEWDVVGGEAPEPLMDQSQVREWLAAGHDIGSHTLTHPKLAKLPLAQAREEISASKRKLEDIFGRPIKHFCYPYGNWSPAVRDLVADAGYCTGCTLDSGLNLPGADAFALRRFFVRYRSRSLKDIRRWFQRFWWNLRQGA